MVLLIVLCLIKAFILPHLCKKYGHKLKDRFVTIRKRSSGFRQVCTDYEANIPTCVRCGACESPEIIKPLDSYNSVSMPTEWWREMDRDGYIIL